MALTWGQIVYQALRKCGQLRAGAGANTDLITDGILECQSILDGWQTERTMSYWVPAGIFAVTGPGHGTNSTGQTFGGCGYQIGPTSVDFVGAPRPVSIVKANLIQNASSAVPNRVPLRILQAEEWGSISVPQLPATSVPSAIYYDPQIPNGVIWFYPPPTSGNVSIELFVSGGFVGSPVDSTTPFILPQGYQDALVWTLATRMWPLCDKSIMINKISLPYIVGQSEIAIGKVRRLNRPALRLRNDFQGGGGAGGFDRNITYTGYPN